MNKLLLLLLLLLCSGFLLNSCIKEPGGGVDSPTQEDATVSFGLKLPSSSAPSRSGATTAEVAKDMRIEKISILVFDTASKKFLYGRIGTVPEISETGVVSFTAKLRVSATSVTLHLFANTDNINPAFYDGQTESEVFETLVSIANLNAVATTSLPMHGILNLDKIDVITTVPEVVSLLRSVARVDVDASGVTASFKLEGVMAYFTPDKGCLVSNSTDAPTMPATVIPSTTDILSSVSIDNKIENQLFLYENIVKSLPDRSSRVVVKGIYDGKTCYYPVDFSDATGFIPVRRNYNYVVNIISVTGPGYDSSEEASMGTSSDITVTIIKWYDGGLSDIIFDGANWFSIEGKSIVIGGAFGSSDALKVRSTIKSADWSMAWSDSDVTPTSDKFIKGNVLDELGFAKVTKPIPALENEDAEGTIVFNSLLPADATIPITKYLFINVNSRLQIRIKVDVLPTGYTMEDWGDEGDDNIEIA